MCRSCVQNILYRSGDLGTGLCLKWLCTDKLASAARGLGVSKIFEAVSIRILLHTSAQVVAINHSHA